MYREDWYMVFGGVAVFVLLLAIAFWGESTGCRSRWSASGFQTSWGPLQGCLISKDGKVWIPDKNYREIP